LLNRNIAGTVGSAVKNVQLLLAKGYGYVDFATKKPLVADQMLFRPGPSRNCLRRSPSCSWIEQGKLDPDPDMNEYVDFEIPKAYSEPVMPKSGQLISPATHH
jgi:hypothetical protein